MRGFSKAIIAGNLVRDPEMRATPSGAQVCSFALAVNRTYFWCLVVWSRGAGKTKLLASVVAGLRL